MTQQFRHGRSAFQLKRETSGNDAPPDGNFGKEEKPEPVKAKISQETLAEMVGTTRSPVNVFMNKFRKLGLIEYNGEMKVHNSLLNVLLQDWGRRRSILLRVFNFEQPAPALIATLEGLWMGS